MRRRSFEEIVMQFGTLARGSLLLPLLISHALGQTTRPADQSTPQGTLKLLFTANAVSDGNTLRSLLLAESPAQQHMLLAMVDKKNADHDLTKSLMARFSDQWKTDPFLSAQRQLPPVFERIDQAQMTLDGDTASLQASAASTPFTLKRTDGKWRIPLAVMFRNIDSDQLEQHAHEIDIQVRVMRSAAVDVNAGKYASQADALQDIKEKMFNAAIADHAAATQPAVKGDSQTPP
jgi:hypothetical protein